MKFLLWVNSKKAFHFEFPFLLRLKVQVLNQTKLSASQKT